MVPACATRQQHAAPRGGRVGVRGGPLKPHAAPKTPCSTRAHPTAPTAHLAALRTTSLHSQAKASRGVKQAAAQSSASVRECVCGCQHGAHASSHFVALAACLHHPALHKVKSFERGVGSLLQQQQHARLLGCQQVWLARCSSWLQADACRWLAHTNTRGPKP